ncbi:MAG: apolipoprotein N-acyltransferase [candidate division WOR-3 bacterium]|nr:MAG: apolipoprotein N-acyltransferase [candidate division WOR-3 bacterium]
MIYLKYFFSTNRIRLALATVSAVLCSLSFHPIGCYFLAWIGLVPLLFAIENMKPADGFRTGIVFGFVFSLCSLFWLVFLQIDINIKILMLFGLILMFLYFGVWYGTAVLFTRMTSVWLLPFAFAGLDFLRSLGELGFPWLCFGYSQARYPAIMQQASIYGVFGVTFWLVLVNVLVYKTLKAKSLKYAALLIVVFGLPLLYGGLRIRPATGTPVLVGVVQPNIDPNLKFTKAMRDETFVRLLNISEQCHNIGVTTFGNPPDIVFWPETATPVFLHMPGKHQDQVRQLADRLHMAVFTGTPLYDPRTRDIYNGAVLVEPQIGITQHYRKIHLVPFGEHIPFDQHVPLFKKIDVGGGDYAPGSKYTVFQYKEASFGCLICFESIFTDISRTMVRQGARFLVNITNDGWFGTISGPQQHNDMAIVRAVENGVPLVRSANTGISMIVDRYGRIQHERGLFQEDHIVDHINITAERTLYTTFGDILPVICLFIIGVSTTAAIVKKRKTLLHH